MVRSPGALAVIPLVVLLVACAPASEGAAPPTSPAPSASPTPTPTGSALDGEWLVQLSGADAGCILTIGYRVLTVHEGVGTLDAGTAPLVGPAELDGDTVTLHLERTTPSKDALDLTATLGADGVARGTADAGGIHSGGNGYTCAIPLSLVRAGAPADMPAFDTIEGTWCDAVDQTTCMTITGRTLALEGSPPDSTLHEPRSSGFGSPCHITGASPMDPNSGGGFALYFCPEGYAIQPGSGGIEGEIVAEHDNVAFDRLYGTQNPPYLGVYFRKEDLAAALQQ